MAKFAATNNKSASTKLLLFFATKAMYYRINFDIVNLLNINTYEWILK